MHRLSPSWPPLPLSGSSPASEAPPAHSEDSESGAIALADLIAQHALEQVRPSVESCSGTPGAPAGEVGGRRDGPEPTRYGDWEKNGRCIDF